MSNDKESDLTSTGTRRLSGLPYEVLYLGGIAVTLSDAGVYSRPRRVEGRDAWKRS
jgi:hypothetical protein